MTHRPLYAKKNHPIRIFIILICILCGIWYLTPRFNPQNINEQSSLKNRTFAGKPNEIAAPKSGLKAYFLAENSNPIIAVNFVFEGAGSISDPKNLRGLANLTAQMMTEGAGDLNSRSFKEELENYAIEISYGADLDNFSGQMLTTKDNLPRAIKMLRSTLLSPRLEQKDLYRLQQQTISAIERMQENPSTQLQQKNSQIVFADHPYATPTIGIKNEVAKITSADIRNFINNQLSQDNLFIGIAGDLTTDEAEKIIDDVFSDIPQKNNILAIKVPNIDYSIGRTNIAKDTPQVLTQITTEGVSRQSKEFYPLYIANYIFGGSGLNSRLNQAAREKEGLTYGASTYLVLLNQSPLLSGQFSTTPQNFVRMQQIFDEEWKKMGEKGVSQQELDAAKNYLISSFNLRFSDISTIAEILAQMQKEKLGIDFLQKRNDYIKNVNLEQINLAAQRYFIPEKLIITNYGTTQTGEEKHEKDHKQN